MRRVSTIALIVAWVASFACAQRASSHGGSSGHSGSSSHSTADRSAPAFHGAFTRSAPARMAAPPHYRFGAPGSHFTRPIENPRTAPGFARRAPGNLDGQSGFADRSRHRMPYRSPYRHDGDSARDHRHDRDTDRDRRHIYQEWPALFNPYLYSPYFLSYPDSLDYSDGQDDNSYVSPGYPPDDSASQPNPVAGYPPQPADQGQQDLPPWPSYNPPPPPATAPETKSVVPESVASVTIVFNDGRPPQQIHNYVITPTTLYIFDKQRHEIPLDHLDLVATAKANRDAGVDFNLPVPAR